MAHIVNSTAAFSTISTAGGTLFDEKDVIQEIVPDELEPIHNLNRFTGIILE